MKKIILTLFITSLLFGCASKPEEGKKENVTSSSEQEIDTVVDEEVNEIKTSEIEETPEIIQEKNEEIITAPKDNECKPEVVYSDNYPKEEDNIITGSAALKQNLKDITVIPEYMEGRLKRWNYKEGTVYQVHTQTYHSTMLELEPGEKLVEQPYISEPDVWRIAWGVGFKDNLETIYLMIKPDYINLCSTLILITNRRVYQMELRSYNDHYMPTVRWNYNTQLLNDDRLQAMIDLQKQEYQLQQEKAAKGNKEFEFCSFDYTIKNKRLKTPSWYPKVVYDDGKFTYIVLDNRTMVTDMPTVFLDNKKLVNTEINQNVIQINQLITKVTLKLGNQKVVIKKQKTK